MSQTKPPALAGWVLRHFLLGGRNEALEGDLLEEFQHRRSAAWYWRQVLRAIVASLVGQLRQHWKLLSLEAAFVLAWTYYSLLFLRFAQARFWVLAFEPHGRFLWWVLMRCNGIVSVVIPLAIYLAYKRFTNLLPVLWGLCAGIVVAWALALPTLALALRIGGGWVIRWPIFLHTFFSVEAAGMLPYAVVHPWWVFPSNLLRQSAPLLFAIWAGHLSVKKRQSPSFQS